MGATPPAGNPCGSSYCVFDLNSPCPKAGKCHGAPDVSCSCDDTLDKHACQTCAQSFSVDSKFRSSTSYGGGTYPLAGTFWGGETHLSFLSSSIFVDVTTRKTSGRSCGPYLLEHRKNISVSAQRAGNMNGVCPEGDVFGALLDKDEWFGKTSPSNAATRCCQDVGMYPSTCCPHNKEGVDTHDCDGGDHSSASIGFSRPELHELSDFGTMRRYTWWTNAVYNGSQDSTMCICSNIDQALYQDLGMFSHNAERWKSTAISFQGHQSNGYHFGGCDEYVACNATISYNVSNYPVPPTRIDCKPYNKTQQLVEATYQSAAHDATTGVMTALATKVFIEEGCGRYGSKSNIDQNQDVAFGPAQPILASSMQQGALKPPHFCKC